MNLALEKLVDKLVAGSFDVSDQTYGLPSTQLGLNRCVAGYLERATRIELAFSAWEAIHALKLGPG
jgi:hypothetical protein